MKNQIILLFFAIFISFSCSKNDGTGGETTQNLTIFFFNDPHAQLDNFSKIKHIVDEERSKTKVILACSGDIFSGNPVVDNYQEKGYPMIDMMNRVGFDVAVLGNHEFDYGESILKDRMQQTDFEWICANVDVQNSVLPQPEAYTTIEVGELKITFLGLLETNGKENGTIPSTHPWRVENFNFTRPELVVGDYADLKTQEQSDLYIALSHLGHDGNNEILGDFQLADQFPFFDLILGGHSHYWVDTKVNNIPIFQTGSYLNYLGKLQIEIRNKKATSVDYELIDLNAYPEFDAGLKTVIDEYNDLPELKEVVGYSHQFHNKSMLGCFYTDALRLQMDVDVSFQNTGGIRSGLDEGDITRQEIYEIDPFNNGTVIYSMSVKEIKDFLKGSGSGFYYSGLTIRQVGNSIYIYDLLGHPLTDNTILKVGINDYIPAVHDEYFPADGSIQPLTSAETIIQYLENVNDQIDYSACQFYFRYEY